MAPYLAEKRSSESSNQRKNGKILVDEKGDLIDIGSRVEDIEEDFCSDILKK